MTTTDNASLAADVARLEEGHAALRGEVRDFKMEVSSGFASIRATLDSGLARLSSAVDAKTSTNWAPIGILAAALGTVFATVVSALVAVGIAISASLREQASVTNAHVLKLQEESARTQVDLAFIKGQHNPVVKP